MNDINKFSGENLGGLIRFNFAVVSDILTIEEAVDSKISKVIKMKPGTRWYSGYATLGTMSFTEPTEETNAGPIYKRSFNAFCPKDDEEKTDLFARMRNEKFILDITDSNCLRKIIGSINEPLSFKSTLNKKANMPELAGYAISFFGDGTHPSYIYNV